MTWNRITQSPVAVGAWQNTNAAGEQIVQLTVGTQVAQLSVEDAASLGGYLLQFAPDLPQPGVEA